MDDGDKVLTEVSKLPPHSQRVNCVRPGAPRRWLDFGKISADHHFCLTWIRLVGKSGERADARMSAITS